MKNKYYVILLTSLLLLFSVTGGASAQDRYYHKGIVYGSTSQTSSSAVVMAASAMNYDGVKKEHVAVYSRCDVMRGAYNAGYCVPKTIQSTLYASNSSGTKITNDANTIGQIAPVERLFSHNLPDFTPIITNYWYNAAWFVVNAVFNQGASATSIKHERDSMSNSATVTYNYPTKSILDVPNTIKYTDILGYYSDKAKGLSTNYQILMGSGYLTAKAKIVYEMGREVGYYDIYRFNVSSYEAKLTHSIGM